MKIQSNILLTSYNTFGISATAAFFVEINAVKDLEIILSQNKQKKIIIGGGSNILFTENLQDSLLIKNNIKGIAVARQSKKQVYVEAGAGELWQDFVQYQIKI